MDSFTSSFSSVACDAHSVISIRLQEVTLLKVAQCENSGANLISSASLFLAFPSSVPSPTGNLPHFPIVFPPPHQHTPTQNSMLANENIVQHSRLEYLNCSCQTLHNPQGDPNPFFLPFCHHAWLYGSSKTWFIYYDGHCSSLHPFHNLG